MGNLVSYHLGSVACGSFLITLFKLPRLILTYLYAKYVSLMHKIIMLLQKFKIQTFYRFEKNKETSPCAQCGLKCCICCFYCLEKFIRYMNHNAYTVVAIEGTHFCNAAKIVYIYIYIYFIYIKIYKNNTGNEIIYFLLFIGIYSSC